MTAGVRTSLTGGNEISRLVRDLGKLPPELRKQLRPAVKRAAAPVLTDARRRASWSTRIPSALRIATSFSKKRAGVSIVANRNRAPHARPFEGITGRTSFRHPVYGNRETWVEQRTRPFLAPAVEANALRVVAQVNQAVDQAARDAGFRR